MPLATEFYRLGRQIEDDERRRRALESVSRFEQANALQRKLASPEEFDRPIQRLSDSLSTPEGRSDYRDMQQSRSGTLSPSEAKQYWSGSGLPPLELAAKMGLLSYRGDKNIPEVSAAIRGQQEIDFGRAAGQYSETIRGDDPSTASAINVLNRLSPDRAADLVQQFAGGKQQQSMGRSATAARLRFAKENPEMVNKVKGVIKGLVDEGLFSENYGTTLSTLAEIDPLKAIDGLERARRSTETAIATLKETMPTKVETAARTTTARETAKAAAPKELVRQDRDELRSVYDAISVLESTKSLFDKRYVGPVRGRFAKMNQLLGTIGADEAVFRGTDQRFKNVLIKDRSGAAVTANEMERVNEETMDFNLTPEAYIAKLNQNIRMLKEKYNRHLEILRKARVNTLEFNPMNIDAVDVEETPEGGSAVGVSGQMDSSEFDRIMRTYGN